jgi:hypothetical protein
VVGIDMGADYIDYIEGRLEAEGHQATDWPQLLKRLKQPSRAWSHWAGNQANFRKPGRSKAS